MSIKFHRATIDFEPTLLQALQQRAEDTRQSLSDLVNNAVRILLAEDEDDVAALEDRKDESSISFEELVEEMKDSGEL